MVTAIVDAGPLVSYLDRDERYYAWVSDRIEEFEAPLLVCEPVLTEAMHLLRRSTMAQQALLGFLEAGALVVAFQAHEHIRELRALHLKYRDLPMSLADACIVRMAELYDRHAIFTLDSDFLVYRKNGRTPLSVIHPASN